MRRTTAALAFFLALAPVAAQAQSAAPPLVQQRAQAEKPFDYYPLVLGAGAIAGVIGFNVLALGVEALPGGLAYGTAVAVPAESSVAMSRVYAVTSAVTGALVAYYMYVAP